MMTNTIEMDSSLQTVDDWKQAMSSFATLEEALTAFAAGALRDSSDDAKTWTPSAESKERAARIRAKRPSTPRRPLQF
jgi:hypothetical protein